MALQEADAEQLRQWVSAFGTPQQVALRSRIVLAAAEGQSDTAIARGLAVNRKTVLLWRERFAEQGLGSMWEVGPGRGRKPNYGRRKIAAMVSATLTTKPKGMTQWSCRRLAEAQGVSKSTVHNIWQAHQLQPHREQAFKLSRDAKFLEKLTDVVGLYLNPPQQALVLCVELPFRSPLLWGCRLISVLGVTAMFQFCAFALPSLWIQPRSNLAGRVRLSERQQMIEPPAAPI